MAIKNKQTLFAGFVFSFKVHDSEINFVVLNELFIVF